MPLNRVFGGFLATFGVERGVTFELEVSTVFVSELNGDGKVFVYAQTDRYMGCIRYRPIFALFDPFLAYFASFRGGSARIDPILASF